MLDSIPTQSSHPAYRRDILLWIQCQIQSDEANLDTNGQRYDSLYPLAGAIYHSRRDVDMEVPSRPKNR